MDESIYREIGNVKKPLSINYYLKELYVGSNWSNQEKNITELKNLKCRKFNYFCTLQLNRIIVD